VTRDERHLEQRSRTAWAVAGGKRFENGEGLMLRLGTILLGSALVVAGHGMAAAQTASGEIDFMTFGDPAEKAAYETLVAAFEATHPEIDVTIVHVPDQADYRRRLATDFSAGTPADIVFINYRRCASLAAKGAIEPLGPYLAKSRAIEESDFYAETIKPFYWEGKLQCIPQNLSSLVVYYNKSLFDTAGAQYPADDWNWDDFLATAKALTKDTDGDGTIDQYGLGTEASIFRLAPFVWQNGVTLSTIRRTRSASRSTRPKRARLSLGSLTCR
jgi:multiple sugar transport system substrate-binding protein